MSLSNTTSSERLHIAFFGCRNAGKSSLVNAVTNQNLSVVSDIKGTTRDIVEGSIILSGIEVNFFDTAGIRETQEVVEAIGIEKSIKKIDESNLILFVVDPNTTFDEEDKIVLDKIKDKNVLVIYNKNDLSNKKIKELDRFDSISISCMDDESIKLLKDKIVEIFNLNDIEKLLILVDFKNKLSFII